MVTYMSDQDRKDDLDILDISEEDETSKEPSDETSEEKTKDEKTTEEDYDKDTEYEVCALSVEDRRVRQAECSSCLIISPYVQTVCTRQWIQSVSSIIRDS